MNAKFKQIASLIKDVKAKVNPVQKPQTSAIQYAFERWCISKKGQLIKSPVQVFGPWNEMHLEIPEALALQTSVLTRIARRYGHEGLEIQLHKSSVIQIHLEETTPLADVSNAEPPAWFPDVAHVVGTDPRPIYLLRDVSNGLVIGYSRCPRCPSYDEMLPCSATKRRQLLTKLDSGGQPWPREQVLTVGGVEYVLEVYMA